MNIGIILSGGIGIRANTETPKQYVKINGKMVIEYVIDILAESPLIDVILIAGDRGYFKVDNFKNKPIYICKGGKSRNATVYNALEYIRLNIKSCDKVIFCDSARPFLTQTMINGIIETCENYGAAITVQAITDSLGKMGEGSVDRSEFYLIQTPEAFKFSLLRDFSAESESTAIAEQLKAASIGLYKSEEFNLKVTYKSDFEIAKRVLNK